MPKGYARTDRIAEQIQREVAQLLRLEVKDPRVRMITLTGVEVTKDYSHAKVFYTTLDGVSDATQKGLEHASGYLRSQLAHSMKLRIMPQLHFVYDPSIERGAHLSQLIDQAVVKGG
jgi:ribosome-binding factor A